MDNPDAIAIQPLHRPVDCTLRLPGSKSLSNRALLTAALAHGTSELSGLLYADDTRYMIDCIRAMGVAVAADEFSHTARITGCGGHWPASQADLYCGNAGTVIRFMTAACCIGTGAFTLDGDGRMRERPIGDLVTGLRELGALIDYASTDGVCPLNILARGLRGGTVRFDRPISSQFVSAILMAAPSAALDVMLDVSSGMPSTPYVAMTIAVMEAFGVSVVADRMMRFIVPARQTYQGVKYEVEPDASGASYFLAAAAICGGRVTIEGLGSGSLQGDFHFVDVLEKMGCQVERQAHQVTLIGPPDGRLRGVDVDLSAMPDVAQTLAVLAAFSDGPTRIRNVGNLRVKETDRLVALATELGHLGVESEIHDDGITIRPNKMPKPGYINTYGDHRMAMSFALAGLRVDGVVIREPACVSKSFPDFFERWKQLYG